MIKIDITISIPAAEAFIKFVHEINKWWPAKYTWSQYKLQEIKIELVKNGLCSEIGPYGFRCDWGRITAVEKNKQLSFK